MKGVAIFILILSLLMTGAVIYLVIRHNKKKNQTHKGAIHNNQKINGNKNPSNPMIKCYKCKNKQCVEFSPCPSPYEDPGFPYYEN